MGNCGSTDSTTKASASPNIPAAASAASKSTAMEQNGNSIGSTAQMDDFTLKKKRPGCTGMFWRSDPTGQTQLKGGHNWPKDNATLRGETVIYKGEKWLKTYQVKQKGGNWKDAPEGAFMPFEYNDHYYLDPSRKS